MMDDFRGMRPVRHRRGDPAWEAQLKEANDLIEYADRTMPLHLRDYALREVMTTDSFPLLFADSLDREVLARFRAANPVMESICKVKSGRDFKTRKRERLDGLTGRLQKVAEKGEYLAGEMTENEFTYAVEKWGRQCDFSFETLINDDLGAFSDVPQRLATACINTKQWFITQLFWAAAGPRAAYFSAANGGAAIGTGVLNAANLITGITAMGGFTDAGGDPILSVPAYLVVPPALAIDARQFITTAFWAYAVGAGAAAAALPTLSALGDYNLKLIVNPWLPIVDTTTGNTTWALFTDTNNIAAAEFGKLLGHEEPEIYIKASDQQRIGGGMASPFDGDFATDDIMYKIRYIFGGVTLDGQAGYCSNGTV